MVRACQLQPGPNLYQGAALVMQAVSNLLPNFSDPNVDQTARDAIYAGLKLSGTSVTSSSRLHLLADVSVEVPGPSSPGRRLRQTEVGRRCNRWCACNGGSRHAMPAVLMQLYGCHMDSTEPHASASYACHTAAKGVCGCTHVSACATTTHKMYCSTAHPCSVGTGRISGRIGDVLQSRMQT